MNMKMIAGACLCAAAIVGCVSLEERLASTDPAVRKEAEQDLIRQQNYVLDANARMDAVKRVQDEEVLCNFAMTIDDPLSERYQDRRPEAMVAVEKITKDELLAKIAVNGASSKIRSAAFGKIKNAKVKEEVKKVVEARDKMEQAKLLKRIEQLIDKGDERRVNALLPSLVDIDALEKLQAECVDWRSHTNYQNYKLWAKLDENKVVLSRLLSALESQQAIADWFVRYVTERNKSGLSIDNLIIDEVLKKVTDEKTLFSLANFTLTKDPEGISASKFYDRITDGKLLAKFALDIKGDLYWNAKIVHAGERAVAKIKDKDALIELAFFANHHCISGEAKRKLDTSTYVAGLAKLIKEKKLSPERMKILIEGLEDNQATVDLYDSISNAKIKSVAFGKLCEKDRKFLRNRNRAVCEKRIADAKVKGKDTFELGGFYLGMNISEVDDLVGYYCPEWSNSEDYVDDGKTIRGLWVPQQKGAFCRAGKDGKVFEFNFGKNFLKNFYKFDVQNEREWAAAYSRKEGVDLRYVHLNEDVKVVDYNDPGVPYHALYSQDTYTYKNNSKDYRITYFGEQKISAGNGLVKQEARLKMQYVGGQQGMLRVRIEKD